MAKAASDIRSEHPTFPPFALFVFMTSLREEIGARKVARTAERLPRYVERDCSGNLSFRVDRSPRVRLPNDPTTSEFRAAYNAALVDAIAAEDDHE
ncbi:hypothetical protein [Bradyrhizobium sp. LB11.1]|uniref:hypothetical protein n=1 Tax=Bradyrhizobium sp. LB11.1 TaxID=3156326 RepID=UPI003397D320